jgi:DNA replication protein DnaC
MSIASPLNYSYDRILSLLKLAVDEYIVTRTDRHPRALLAAQAENRVARPPRTGSKNPQVEKKDIILIGNPGVGKSLLAKTVAYAATQQGFKVLFTTAMDMINHLVAAEADHSLSKKLHHYACPQLLLIDELGYLPLGTRGSNLFFQVNSQRHEKKSTLITTNLPFADWATIFDSTWG